MELGPAELDLPAIALGSARVAPIGLALSTLGQRFVPASVAVSLVLALGVAMAPAVGAPALPSGVPALVLALIREVCVGASFAVALSLALLVAPWALRLSHPAMPPVLASLYGMAACWAVLALGGGRALLMGLADSYRDAPVASTPMSAHAFALGVAQLTTDALITALGVGLPLLAAGWLFELVRALTLRAIGAGVEPAWLVLRPLLLTMLAALLLVPTVSQAPALVRSALAAARTLTRALVQ